MSAHYTPRDRQVPINRGDVEPNRPPENFLCPLLRNVGGPAPHAGCPLLAGVAPAYSFLPRSRGLR